jgi:hypothetical protein
MPLGVEKIVVGQLWQRGVLRRAAQRYAGRGWRVVPGAFLIGDRYVCGPLCPTVACHPAVDHWERTASSDLSEVDSWWEQTPFSVLLATGHAFDVIEAPARLGAPAAHRYRTLGPIAVTPAGRWMFLVRPGESLRPELAAQLDVVLHGQNSWIPAPPTRTPHGRVRWECAPAAVDWRLPDPYDVQQVLLGDLAGLPTTPTRTLRRAA